MTKSIFSSPLLADKVFLKTLIYLLPDGTFNPENRLAI